MQYWSDIVPVILSVNNFTLTAHTKMIKLRFYDRSTIDIKKKLFSILLSLLNLILRHNYVIQSLAVTWFIRTDNKKNQ